MEDERADAGRDSSNSTRDVRLGSHERTGSGKISLPFSADPWKDWQLHTVDAHFSESDGHTQSLLSNSQ